MTPLKIHFHIYLKVFESHGCLKKVNGARMHRHIVNKKIDYRVLQSKTRL